MGDRNKLEHLDDGFIAFHDEDGRRWRHRDVVAAAGGDGYRLFISDAGEERHYHFGARESHDATIHDLRDQLRRATPPSASAAPGTAGETAAETPPTAAGAVRPEPPAA